MMEIKQRAPRVKLKLTPEEKAELLEAMPEPDYTYPAVIHGQHVTVKRYASVKPKEVVPEAAPTELPDEEELLRLHALFNPNASISIEEYLTTVEGELDDE